MCFFIDVDRHQIVNPCLTAHNTGSFYSNGNRMRKSSAGIIADSLWLCEGDEDEEEEGLKSAPACNWCMK